jgi:Tol biopolymer transport system component
MLGAFAVRSIAALYGTLLALVTAAMGFGAVVSDSGEIIFSGYRSTSEQGVYRLDIDTRIMMHIGGVRGGCCIEWLPGGIAMISHGGRVVWFSADGRSERVYDRENLLYSMSDWSPDGTQFIAPATDFPDDLQIVNVTGEVSRRLPNLSQEDGSVIYPRWSPDARHILYTLSGGENGIYSLDLGNGEPRRLIDVTQVKRADWSPSGEQIVFVSSETGQSKIFLMQPDGGQPHPLLFGSDTQEYEPQWSPDGSKIAFMSNKGRRFNLHMMPCDPVCDGETHQLTHSGLSEWVYAWSPDSDKIAVIAPAQSGVGVFILDTDNGTLQLVSTDFRLINTLLWRP